MHDAFISYSRRDAQRATELRAQLQSAGVATFLDRTGLTPGRPWQPELERALQDCRAVIVLVGRDGLGS